MENCMRDILNLTKTLSIEQRSALLSELEAQQDTERKQLQDEAWNNLKKAFDEYKMLQKNNEIWKHVEIGVWVNECECGREEYLSQELGLFSLDLGDSPNSFIIKQEIRE